MLTQDLYMLEASYPLSLHPGLIPLHSYFIPELQSLAFFQSFKEHAMSRARALAICFVIPAACTGFSQVLKMAKAFLALCYSLHSIFSERRSLAS